jgi:hypothetical protein
MTGLGIHLQAIWRFQNYNPTSPPQLQRGGNDAELSVLREKAEMVERRADTISK